MPGKEFINLFMVFLSFPKLPKRPLEAHFSINNHQTPLQPAGASKCSSREFFTPKRFWQTEAMLHASLYLPHCQTFKKEPRLKDHYNYKYRSPLAVAHSRGTSSGFGDPVGDLSDHADKTISVCSKLEEMLNPNMCNISLPDFKLQLS